MTLLTLLRNGADAHRTLAGSGTGTAYATGQGLGSAIRYNDTVEYTPVMNSNQAEYLASSQGSRGRVYVYQPPGTRR